MYFTNVEFVKLKVSGFKGTTQKEVREINLVGKNILITGDNATGKTSILDEICYTIFGTNRFGFSQLNSELINNESKKGVLQLTIKIAGELHLIEKRCSKTRTIKFDEEVKTQEEINSIFDKDLFLCQINPLYFMKLTSEEKRTILVKYLRNISKDNILSLLQPEYIELLKGINVDEYNAEITRINKEKGELLDTKTFLEGKIEVFETKIEIPDEVIFDDTELRKLNSLIETLDAKKLDTKHYQTELEQVKEKLTILKLSFKPQSIDALLQTKAILRESYNAKRALLKSVKFHTGDVCRECGQIINEEHFNKLQSEIKTINKMVQAEMKSLIERGNKVNDEIARITQENIDAKKKYEEDLSSINNKISELNKKVNPELNQQIDNKIFAFKQKIKKLESDKRNAIEVNTRRQVLLETRNKNMEYSEKYKKQILEIEKKSLILNNKVFALKTYKSEYNKKLKEFLSSSLNKVTFVLDHIVEATGESKPCFELLYEGKTQKLLSTSEEIKAGIEIGDLLRTAMGINYPVFIDCGESVTSYNTDAIQVLEARVVKGLPLTVTPLDAAEVSKPITLLEIVTDKINSTEKDDRTPKVERVEFVDNMINTFAPENQSA